MTTEAYVPYFVWGSCLSKDKENPDVLRIEPLEKSTFESEFSTNIRAKVNGVENIFQLHFAKSKNLDLLKKFRKAESEGKIKVGQEFIIKTYMGNSTSNKEFPMRRFLPLEF